LASVERLDTPVSQDTLDKLELLDHQEALDLLDP
jgi:hypothetical protein